MRTLLICHHDAPLHHEGIARWLASFSDLAGVLVVRERPAVVRRRARRELRRVGAARFLDVLAFRVYHRLREAARVRAWEEQRLAELRARFPGVPATVPSLESPTPNTPAAEQFVRACQPELIVAFTKHLIAERIFTVPRLGTFVMHPGICPEYRNAHGCFWAMARGDVENVGMTLLRIDRGVDTGPVFGYFRCTPDEVHESHIIIQHRTVFDNLDTIQRTLESISSGEADTIDTHGRPSAAWGQPWFSSYVRWKWAARDRARAHRHA